MPHVLLILHSEARCRSNWRCDQGNTLHQHWETQGLVEGPELTVDSNNVIRVLGNQPVERSLSFKLSVLGVESIVDGLYLAESPNVGET